MERKLIELTNKQDVYKTYDIYRHCMFLPTEEKFRQKADKFLQDGTVKIYACFHRDVMEGVIVVSFASSCEMEILGIATGLSCRGKGVGSYLIHQLVSDYSLHSVHAETDHEAVGFYRKNGFTTTAFPETYHGETVTRYQCKLNL